jgi:hypothetical protein
MSVFLLSLISASWVMANVPGKVGIEEYVDNFLAEVCT